MANLGLDIGTKTIVIAIKDNDGKIQYLSEINGYWPFERGTPFIENMLNDPNKIRSDGTKRTARYFKDEDSKQLIVLGKDAEEFAYSKNDTLLRPMAEGGISPDDMAITVLTAIIHGLISMAENQIGKFDDTVKICYCTTATAINKQNNIPYHERAVDLILRSYQSAVNIEYNKIKESHAIVINMSPDGTGIGISWGAGTVTVSYVKYGLEIYSFCWVGAGDWIDVQTAMRHGYDPEMSKFRKKSKETPTTVAKRKTEIDLTPGIEYKDRLSLDIVLHYDVLISQVIDGIIQGFVENEAEARIEDGIDIFMAGGTSSPNGFAERVKAKFAEKETPFEIKDVQRHDNPLLCVAEGCLKASEMF
jgi:actin-like ATPase involved in cell morphogenesis